jgi:hypothetical protein
MKSFLHLTIAIVAVSVSGWSARVWAQTTTPARPAMAGQSVGKGAAAPPAIKTVSGLVKGSKAAGSLTINTDDGKDWKFSVDSSTKVTGKEGSRAGGADPGSLGVGPQAVTTKGAAKPAVANQKTSVTDIGMGDLVSVTYDEVGGTMHAASVRVMTKYVDRFR